MEELEPKKRLNVFNKEFLAKYSYVLVLAVLLIGGISFSYTFFTQNRKIASGSITTANLDVTFGNRSINATGLTVPASDQEGLSEYAKKLTITNTTSIDGKFKLSLSRTLGLELTDLRYAVIVNGAIQDIGDVPNDGEIFSSAIMGNEVINMEVRLWPKTTYSGSATGFAGEITPEVRYLGKVASSLSSPAGKYVNFNCSSTCEVWQIVKVESDRLVLTRQEDYSGATSRTNSYRYNPSLVFNDDSMITSVSTDDKNVYLAKTVKIDSGEGTLADPYELVNNEFREQDKKVIAVITYKDGATTLGTQNVYYNESNYISMTMNDSTFQHWDDGTNTYVLGDTIISIVSDTDLNAVKAAVATLTLTNSSVTLTMGTNGENPYTYNGDGLLSCTSSDDTKVTCNVDTINNKIELVPVATTTSAVTITISGADGVNYLAPADQTFEVLVKLPTTLSLSPTSGTIDPGDTITSTITTDGDGELSCISSDDTIATCSISEDVLTITGVATGTADITVIQDEGADYGEASAIYQVLISSSN